MIVLLLHQLRVPSHIPAHYARSACLSLLAQQLGAGSALCVLVNKDLLPTAELDKRLWHLRRTFLWFLFVSTFLRFWLSLQQHSVNLGSYWKLSASCSADTKKLITYFKAFKQSGKLHICMSLVRCIFDASGLLVCTLWVLVLPLLSPDIPAIPSILYSPLLAPPHPTMGAVHPARGSWPHQHLPRGCSPVPWPPTPSSWSKGLSAAAPRGGGCISAAVELAAPGCLLDL